MVVLNNTSLNVAIWVPAVDGDFITDYPSRQSRKGRFPRVPVLISQNTDKGASFGQNRSASKGGINTDDKLKESITRVILGPNPDLLTLLRDLLYIYPNIQAVGVPSLEKFPVLTPKVPEVTFLGLQYRRTAALYGNW